MTLFGMYKWAEQTDQKLFDLFVLPASYDSTTKDAIIGNMMLKGGEFEVLYADPLFTREAIGYVAKKWYETFDKWAEALAIEYNPLENYDRNESETSTGTGSAASQSSGTTEGQVSAFDSSDYQNKDKETTSDGTQSQSTSSGSRTSRIHGNIGVTTSQQMLEAELSVRRFSLIDKISDVMLREIVIPVF